MSAPGGECPPRVPTAEAVERWGRWWWCGDKVSEVMLDRDGTLIEYITGCEHRFAVNPNGDWRGPVPRAPKVVTPIADLQRMSKAAANLRAAATKATADLSCALVESLNAEGWETKTPRVEWRAGDVRLAVEFESSYQAAPPVWCARVSGPDFNVVVKRADTPRAAVDLVLGAVAETDSVLAATFRGMVTP